MAKGNEPKVKSNIVPLENLINKDKDIFTGIAPSTIDREKTGIKDSDYEDYGILRKNTDINKIRADNQSGWEQAGSFLTRSAGEIVGGTIGAIGATLELPVAISTEISGGNADFENFLTKFGDSISEKSNEIAPIYREHPGKSFDISDSGWWAEKGVSVASTLSLMFPAIGAVKGLSFLGKVARESQVLGKVMKGLDTMSDLKYFSKIAVSAAVSRNAENFKESFQVVNETKNNLLKEWNENPDKFNEVLNTDVVKELQQEGKQATKENVADFVASKAGWLSYGVNSLNIAFDLVQFAPLFKGYKPKLQLSKGAESLDVLKAQASAIGKSLTKSDYIAHFLRPTGIIVGEQLSEGVEEAINYIGTEEGKNYANELVGKDTKNLSNRLLDYVKDDKMWESAAWGVMGGIAFSGLSNTLGNIKQKMQNKDGNTLKNLRLEEISNRINNIQNVSNELKKIQDDETLSDEQKKENINKIKFTNSINSGLNAIQVGNFDMYLEHLGSANMRKAMIDNGYATEEDVDKAITYSINDVNTAAELYKKNYSLLQTKNIDNNIKNHQIISKSYWEAQTKNEIEKLNNLKKDVELLKNDDINYTDLGVNNISSATKLVALKKLEEIYKGVEQASLDNEGASAISQYQKVILDRVSNEVKELEKIENLPLDKVNPEIAIKQFHIEHKKATIEAYNYKTKFMGTDAYTKILEKQTEIELKNREDKKTNNFKNKIEEEIKNGSHTKESLNSLKDEIKNKEEKDFLTTKIKDLENNTSENNTKEEIKSVKESKNPVQENNTIEGIANKIINRKEGENFSPEEEQFYTNNKEQIENHIKEKASTKNPVQDNKNNEKAKPEHLVFGVFDKEFKNHTIDETKLNNQKKEEIDSYLQGENIGGLLNLHSKLKGTLEGNYLENKITELKEKLQNEFDNKLEIAEQNSKKQFTDDTQINEQAQWELDNINKPKINQNAGLMFKEIDSKSENSEIATIKPLLHILRPLGFNGEIQYSTDENNNLIVSKEIEDAVKELYNSKIGDEIEIKIDSENAYYEKNKENSKDIPLVIIKNGKKIAYISSTSQFNYNVENNVIKNGEEESNLLNNIRTEIGTDLKKSVKMTINTTQKGDVINTKNYYNIQEVGLNNFKFWSLPTGTSSKNTLVSLDKEEKEYISNTTEYGRFTDNNGNIHFKKGLVYLELQNVDGSFFPTPLKINKINEKEAKKIQDLTFKLLKLLNEGVNTTDEKIINLKDELKKYIRVDDTRDAKTDTDYIKSLREEKFQLSKKEQTEEILNKIKSKQEEIDNYSNNRNISFRMHPKTETKPARIEIGYLSPSTGEKRLIIVRETGLQFIDNKGKVFGNNVSRNIETGNIGTFIFNGVQENNPLLTALQFKYHNIDFKSLKNNENYKKELIENGVFQTNVGQLKTTKGEFISNFTNFAIRISKKTDLKVENKQENTEENKQENKQETDNQGFDELFESFNKIIESEVKEELKNSDSETILKTILDNPQSQDIKLSAESIKNTIKNNNIKIEFVDSLPDNYTGSYIIKNNKILINKDYKNLKELQETLLHEIYHSLTILPVIKYMSFAVLPDGTLNYNSYEFKPNTPQEIKDFIKQIENLREFAEKKIKQKYPDITKAKLNLKYGIKNNFEFISEVMSNPEFKEVLKDGDINIIEKIIDAILNFLNNYFKSNFNTYKNKNYENSVKAILNLINTRNKIDYSELKGDIQYTLNSQFASFNKEKDKVFSNEELGNIVNYAFYETSKILKNKADNKFNENSKDDVLVKTQVLENLKNIFIKFDNKFTDEQKELSNRVINNFDTVWKAISRKISSVYNVSEENDNLEIDLNQQTELAENWDKKVTDSLNLNSKLSKEIKWFLSSFPSYTENKLNINAVTGLPVIIDYADIIIPIRKNLSGVQSSFEIIKNLRNLVELDVVYGKIADKLETNLNLLNGFESIFKSAETKQVAILLTPTNEGVKLVRADEMNSAKDYKKFKEEWQLLIDNNIEATILQNKINTLKSNNKIDKELELKLEKLLEQGAKIYDNKFLEEKLKIDKLLIPFKNNKESENYLNNENGITDKGKELVEIFSKQLNLIGLDISLETIKTDIKNARILSDTLLSAIDGLFISIDKQNKKNDTGNLEKIAKIETKFNFKYAELQSKTVTGETINNFELPSFLSNILTKWKSDDSTVKEEVERELREWAENGEDIQYDKMMWKTESFDGLWEYEEQNGRKIPTKLNREFLKNYINVFQEGGGKNTITKDAESNIDLTPNDYLITNLANYLMYDSKNNSNNKLFSMPSLTPSDSPKQTCITLLKTILKKDDFSIIKDDNGNFIKIEIKRTSECYKSIGQLIKQEVVRRKQAFDYIFDEVLSDNNIINKENKTIKEKDKLVIYPKYFNYNTNKLTKEGKIWFKSLEKYYHYGQINYLKDEKGNDTNEVDLLKTLFDSDGKLTGRVWRFHNVKAVNNNERFKNVNSKIGTKDYEAILPIIDDYINDLVNKEIKVFKEANIEDIFKGKHDKTADKSFEALIAEYAINSKIGNVTQQNWFYGTSAQYKNDAEIGKRAKIFNAPGVAPSSNGLQSFYAVTIQDIILKSKDFNTIVENVKNNILEEQSINQKDIETFNIDNISKNLGNKWKEKLKDNKLEYLTYEIVKDYLTINSGDAQGYITVEGMKEALIKRGKMNSSFEEVFKQIESGKQLNSESLKTLQAAKFLYCKTSFNPLLRKMTPVQIKNSYITLLPQFIKNTELELIDNSMKDKNISRLNFESAHKVGATQIYKIHNEDGSLNTTWLNDIKGTEFDYDGEQEQLTIPDHLRDNEQLLATQIAKLIIANLSDKAIYELNGKKLTGTELKKHYFNLLVKNIESSKDKLFKDLDIQIDEISGKYTFGDLTKLKKVLDEEVKDLSNNFINSLELVNGRFLMPLSSGQNAEKFEALLSSLFTNRIMKQKMPGTTLVLASDLFTKKINQEEYSGGIEWQEGHDGVLKSYTEHGKLIVEVVMGRFSSKFFKDNETISIDSIPDEIKTMIAYRIPTQAKHSMVVIKVVGFLPEEQNGLIITPNNLITQMGSDFDIDKLYLMYKHFNINKKGEFNIPKYGTKEEFEFLSNQLKDLREEKRLIDEDDNNISDKATTKLLSAISKSFGNLDINEEIKEVEDKLKELNENSNSKQSRDNEIIDIFKSILTNPKHFKEIHTPAAFDDFTAYAEEMRKIKTSINDIDITSAVGQRMVREQNMIGIAIKGFSANFNAFLPIAQHTNMMLGLHSTYNFKFKISGESNNQFDIIYDKKNIIELYGENNVEFKGDYAFIDFRHFGKTSKGSITNLDGKVITEVASQSLGASVDNNKNPILEDSNINTYTFAQFQTGLCLGIPINLMQNFNNQPIIRKLSTDYINNKSLLNDEDNDKSREKVRNYYESLLFNLLIKENIIKNKSKITKKDILENKKFFTKEERQEFFNYSINDIISFSSGELYTMIEQNEKNINKSDNKTQIKYLKNQLYILNQFNRQKEAGDNTTDIMKALKTDAIGAGPNLAINTELFNLIEKSHNKLFQDDLENPYTFKGIVIKDDVTSAISQIYPKYFNLKQESLYPHLESLFENVNRLGYEILSPIFNTQNKDFLDFKNEVLNKSKKDDKNKELITFFNKTLLNELDLFNNKNISQILGLKEYKDKNIKFDKTIETFKQLSVSEQLNIVKEKLNILLDNKKNHILNQIELDKDIKNTYDKITFNTNYKDVLKDNTFIEQLQNLYDNGDEFQKQLVISLIQYNYFTHGLQFGFKSLSKILPSEILADLQIGEHLYKMKNIDININKDIFYKNNWKNSKYVIPVNNGIQKDKREEDFGIGEETKTNKIHWESSKPTMVIDTQLLYKQKRKIKNAKFIKIKHKEIFEDTDVNIDKVYKKYDNNLSIYNVGIGDFLLQNNKLFKIIKKEIKNNFVSLSYLQGKTEHIVQLTNEMIKIGSIQLVSKNTYFYQVNTLGKDTIIEMSDESVFEDNNITNELENLMEIENLVNNIKENNITNFKNISDKEIDELNNNCTLPK